MPSQQQLKWAQLRVGVTVVVSAIVLATLIIFMGGGSGLFSHKIVVKSYFDNAAGIRVGAPVRLNGVDIGNVQKITIVAGHGLTPVEVLMKISTQYAVRQDATASLSTAGVLGETFLDIDSTKAKGAPARDGTELPIRDHPDLNDMIRASQSSLQNIDILVKRLDRIVAFIESGQGSIGHLIYDESLYTRLNATLNEVQSMVNEIAQGKGSVGKLIASEELYDKANRAVDNLNKIIDEVNQGQGTVGKFLKDPALYNNANDTISKANQLITNVNAGKGALGKFAADEEFAKKLDKTVSNLEELTNKMNSGQGTVGKLMNDPTVYNNVDQMLVETRTLLQAVRENPKKYLTIHVKVF